MLKSLGDLFRTLSRPGPQAATPDERERNLRGWRPPR